MKRIWMRLISITLCVAIVVTGMPFLSGRVEAAVVTPDYSWYGDGSASSFVVNDTVQLIAFANLVNGTDGKTATDFIGKTVVMAADIELTGVEWLPIGDNRTSVGFFPWSGTMFRGVFDGNNHIITGLTVNITGSNENVTIYGGLFGVASSQSIIKNLTILNPNISVVGGNSSGEISSAEGGAYSGAVAGATAGIIENCHVVGGTVQVVCNPNGSSDVAAGGIVGHNSDGTISGCGSSTKVKALALNTTDGIYADKSMIPPSFVGGITGRNSGNISNCYAVGDLENQILLGASYANSLVGGIAGLNYGSIANCHFSGTVTGNQLSDGKTAGIVGDADFSSEARDCYYNNEKVMNPSNSTGTGLTLLQMMDPISFSGWDFSTIWEMGTSYPTLKSVVLEPPILEECKCVVGEFSITSANHVVIPYGEDTATYSLVHSEPTVDASQCTIEGHNGTGSILYNYFIEPLNGSPVAGASIDSTNRAMTFSEIGTYQVDVIAFDSISQAESHQSIVITVTTEECICEIPDFTVQNQIVTIPYGLANGEYTFINPHLTLVGDCTLVGHSETQITYTYEIDSKDAGITNAILTSNTLTATGEGKVVVRITANATNTSAVPVSILSEVTFTKEECTCLISDFTFHEGTFIIPYGHGNVVNIFTDPTDAILSPCSIEGHEEGIIEYKYEVISNSNTAGASITGKTLTALTEGSFQIKLTASVSGLGVSKERIVKFSVIKETLTVQDYFKNIQIISGKDATIGWNTNITRDIRIVVKNSIGNTVHTAVVKTGTLTYRIPGTVLTGVKDYSVELIASDDQPAIKVNIKITPPQTSLLFDTAPNVYYDTVGQVNFSWKTLNELTGSNRKVTVKRGNTEYTNFAISGNTVTINNINKPVTNIDTYTITVTSSFDGVVLATGSFVFSVYKTNELEVVNTLDNSILSENTPLNVTNRNLAASLNSDQLLAKVNSFNLQRTIKIKQAVSTYGEDKYQWSVADSKIATIAGSTGMKATYSSAETMILTGLKDGETTVTVKHVPTGKITTFKVTVSTLNGKLYVVQTTVKAVVKLNYTVNGQNKSILTNKNGMAAIYETTGITGEITASGSGSGEIYMGTTNASNLSSGETTTGGTYPTSKISAVAATQITLQLSAKSGSLNTSATLSIKGFLLKNGIVIDTQAITHKPKNLSYENVILNFDTTKLGNLVSTDKIKFVYEITGGNYAPAYATLDATTSGNASFGLARIQLQQAQTNQNVYLNSMILSTPSTGSLEDVSSRTQYVTIDTTSKTKYLKALVCWPKGQVGVPTIVNEKGATIGASSITYTTLSLADMNYGWQEVVIQLDSNLVKSGSSLKLSYSFYNTSNRTTTKIPVSFVVSNIVGIKTAEKLDSVPFSGNVSTGSTGLKILGNKAFDFNLPNGLKAVMQYDFSNDPLNGTFSMLIGYNNKMPEDGDKDYAGAISDVKDLIDKGAKGIGGGEGKFGFKVAGFMMGNVCYRNGEWILVPTGGGLLGAAEVGYSYSQTAVIGIIPVNYGVEFKAGIEATLLIDSTTVTAGVTKENFGEMFDFYLKVYGSVYAYGGIGFDAKIIAARIGIFGTLGLEYYFRTAVIENIRRAGGQLKLTGSIGIEAVVKFLWWKKRYVLCEAGFEKKFKPNGFDYTNYGGFVRPDLPGMKRMMVIKGSDGTDYEVYEGEFEIEDRDYLSAPQVWSGGADDAGANGRARLFGMLNSTVSTKNIATNIYTYADPIVSTDGNLMVILSDFGSIDINETGAAYSIKNSEGVWSAPARISSLITPASNLAFSGSSSFAAAAWEGVEERITFGEEVVSDVDIAASMGKSEIYASVYDGTNFVTKQITNNSEADMIPEISANGDKAIVVWQRIAVSPEDPTKIEGKNEILYSVFNGTSWSDEIVLDSGDAGIVKTFGTAMASDGTAVVTLSIDTDGDSETYPDMEVFNYRIASDGTVSPRIALTSNTSVDSNPQVIVRKLNVKGTEQEYFLTAWYNETAGEEETLRNVILDVRELNGNKVDGFTSSFGPASGNFSFIKSADSNINTVGIVWSEAVSQGASAKQTLYAKLLTDGIDGITTSAASEITTGDPNYVELSELETVAIRNLDSVTLESIYIKKNIEIDQDDIAVLKTNSTDIISTNITIIDTAEIIHVSTDASNASINNSLPVTISVRNNGFSKITGFKVKANDQNYVLDKVLLPDQTTELQIDYLVTNFNNLEIEVTPMYSGSVEGEVIQRSIKLLAPDINIQSITQTGTGNGGSRTFDISLSNAGTKALVDSGYKIKVAVFEDFERKIPSKITDLTMNQIHNGELEISDGNILKAVDEGNGTIRVGYMIEGDSYNSYGNKTLFITITVVDENGFEVNDFNSINNDGGITFVSPKLLYTSQFEVTVVQNNSEGISNADLTVRNLYPVAGEDTLRVRLLEGNTIIEEKTIDIKMGPESITKQTIEFTKSGSNVVAVFGADLVEPTPTPTPTPTVEDEETTIPSEAVVKETGKDGNVEVKATELEKAKTLTVKSDITIVFDETSTKSLAKVGDFKVSVLKADSSILDADIVKNIGDRPIFHITVTSKDKNITSFNGGYVTLSIPYTLMEGETPEAILIYYIDADGNAIPAYSKYDATTKSVRFTTNHFSTYAVAYNKIAFSDVSGWAENYITYLAARNIIVGVGYGKFTPEAQVTRAQFTKMLFGASGLDNSVLEGYKVSGFEDVSSNAWYASYVLWASKNGIANGVGDNKFDPDASITREQMAVMLHNFIKFSEVKLISHSKDAFKDNESISSWALDAVNYINSVSIIDGKGDGMFDPAKSATRAEAAKVVATFIQSLLK